MEELFVPYKESLALKELGFNEECLGYYNGNPHNLQYMYNGKPEKFTDKRMGVCGNHIAGWTSAPLYQQAFKWFREKHEMYSFVETIYIGYNYVIDYEGETIEGLMLSTYEEAELECLRKLIEIVKSKN